MNFRISRACILALSAALALLATPQPTRAEEDPSAPGILLILDASGSMWGQIDGRSKIEIAREAVGELVRELPTETALGLQAYGHRSKGACDDIELLVAPAAGSREAVLRGIGTIQPKGMTPITGALQHAARELETREGETTVVLVSDGKETCAGDPCAAVQALRGRGIRMQLHVVGFDVTDEERAQLACLAEAGGGRYFGAGSTDELRAALASVRQAVAATSEPVRRSVQRPPIGSLRFLNLQTGSAIAIDAESGEERFRYCNGCGTDTQVPAGSYTLRFDNFSVHGVEVAAGEPTVFDLHTVAGVVEIRNLQSGNVRIVDAATGEDRARFCKGCGSNTQVPIGTYALQFPNFRLDGIEVGAGQTVVVDLRERAGTLDFRNHQTGNVEVLDADGATVRARWCKGCGSNTQVPPGTYALRFPNFTVEGVRVDAGQETVFDLATVAGTLAFPRAVQGQVEIIEQDSGKVRARYCQGCGSSTQVPAGRYRIRFPNHAIDDVAVGAGETVVVD